MKEMILYTTHCPKCRILEKKLGDKKVAFTTVEDVNQISKITKSVPVLVVKDQNETKTLNYYDAVKFINQYNS